MKKSYFVFTFFLYFVASFFEAANAESDKQFQRDGETVFEETIETKDGKTIRTIRKGKVRQRRGGPTVGNIEEDEIDEISRRQKAKAFWALGFGPFGSSNVSGGEMLYGLSFGRHWEVTRTAEITADLTGTGNGQGTFVNSALGFSYLPFTGSISPLFGFGLGAGYGSGEDVSAGGFSGQVALGLRMFRLSETQLEIVGTYATVFADGNPNAFGAQLRLLY